MKKMTFEEWCAEADRLSGGPENGRRDTRFICPICKHVATARDFKEAGGDPQLAPQACIGRVTGAGEAVKQEDGTYTGPCNWAAFGLLGTLGYGIEVEMPDGKSLEVFDFAPEEAPAA